MAANSETVDGQAPQDDRIEIDPESGKLDPTNEEAQRALAMINGELTADLPVKTETDTPAPKIEYAEDPRDNIAKNFRTNRGKKADDAEPLDIAGAGDPNSNAMIYGTEIAGAAEAPAAVTPAAAEPNKQPSVRVKVLGTERDVGLDELVSTYQKIQTGDQYLADAARQRNEAEALRARAATETHGAEPQREVPASTADAERPAPTPKRAKLDPAKVAKFVETVQMGTNDEGIQATVDLLESVVPDQNSSDIRSQVREVIASDRIQVSSEEATNKFALKYPALANDGIVQKVAGELVAQEMARDFIAAGIKPEVIAEAMPTPAHIKAGYDMARMKNPSFGRPLERLYEAAEKDNRFQALTGGQPIPPVQVNVDRNERKVVVQQQPAHRSPVPLAQTGQAPLTREQRMSQAIRQQQADRGQSVAV